MKFITKISLLTSIFAAGLTATLSWAQQVAQNAAVPPQVKAVLSHPLAQTKVTDCVDASQSLTWKGAQLSYSSEGLAITGMDAAGRGWKTTIPASGVLTCEVWNARVTGQDADDLAIINYGHSRDGYDTELTLLMFDAQRRPVPWRAIGYFVSSQDGIPQIAATPTGGAVIVVSTKIGDRSDGYAYISNLYETSTAGLHLITGTRTEGTWPAVSGNTKLLRGSKTQGVKSVDLNVAEERSFFEGKLQIAKTVPPPAEQSTARALNNIDLLTVRVAIPDNSTALQESKLLLSDQSTISLPRIVVADKADGTRIIFFAQNVPDGVNELLKGHYSIRATGQSCKEEDCHPFILWGSQTNN